MQKAITSNSYAGFRVRRYAERTFHFECNQAIGFSLQLHSVLWVPIRLQWLWNFLDNTIQESGQMFCFESCHDKLSFEQRLKSKPPKSRIGWKRTPVLWLLGKLGRWMTNECGKVGSYYLIAGSVLFLLEDFDHQREWIRIPFPFFFISRFRVTKANWSIWKRVRRVWWMTMRNWRIFVCIWMRSEPTRLYRVHIVINWLTSSLYLPTLFTQMQARPIQESRPKWPFQDWAMVEVDPCPLPLHHLRKKVGFLFHSWYFSLARLWMKRFLSSQILLNKWTVACHF